MLHTKTILLPKTSLTIIHNLAAETIKTPAQKRLEVLIKHFGLTIYSMANTIGESQQRIHRALQKQKGIDTDLLQAISNHWPEVNMDWLVTGRGYMLHPSEGSSLPSVLQETQQHPYAQDIRIVYRHQYTDYINKYLNKEYLQTLPRSESAFNEPGTFRDFEMNGPQMQDSEGTGIYEGDIIRGQLIDEELYPEVLKPGALIVLVTDTHVMFRMVSQYDGKSITLQSWNPLYPPQKIVQGKIRQIWAYRSLQTARDFLHKRKQ